MKHEADVFMTKYALTSGIIKIRCRIDSENGYASEVRSGFTTIGHFLSKNEYSLTRQEAIAKAEELRIRKLQSLDKQIKKISALKF
jgi:hypothetical protein